MNLRPLAFFALVGCACPPLLDVVPTDGAKVAQDASIRVSFDGKPPKTEFTVTGPDGAIDGTVTYTETEAVFTPAALLPAGATVDYTVDCCAGPQYGSFEVGAIEHASAPEDLEGNTYALDLANATWISPPSGGELISQYFGGSVLVGVEAASSTELDAIGASGQATTSGGWQQDPCFATLDFDPVDFTGNPYFDITTETVEFLVDGTTVKLHNVEISGGLTADEIVEGRFAGEVDFREIAGLENGCGLVTLLGISCTACSSDSEVECLWLEAEDVGGDLVDGLTLVPNENPEECSETPQ